MSFIIGMVVGAIVLATGVFIGYIGPIIIGKLNK